MPASGHRAIARRRWLLGRTRAITLTIAGSAVAGSLGLGTAFARAIPGHAQPAAAHVAGAPAPGRAGPGQPSAAAAASGHSPGPGRAAGSSRPHHGHHRHLTPAPQPPSSTPAPPQVSSGGS